MARGSSVATTAAVQGAWTPMPFALLPEEAQDKGELQRRALEQCYDRWILRPFEVFPGEARGEEELARLAHWKCHEFDIPKLFAALLSVPNLSTLDEDAYPSSCANVKSPFALVTPSTIA